MVDVLKRWRGRRRANDESAGKVQVPDQASSQRAEPRASKLLEVAARQRASGGAEGVPTLQVLRRLGRFARPQRLFIVAAFVMLVGTVAMDLLKPWPLKFALDAVLDENASPGTTRNLLLGVAGMVIATAFLDGLFTYAQAYFINRAGRRIVFDIRSALFDHIQRVSLQFHSRKRTGDLLTRVTSDVKAINEALTESLLQVASSLILLVGMAAVLFWLDWQLALIAVGSSPILLFVLTRYTRKIRRFSRAEREREGALASVLHETLGAIRLTKVFNREEETRRRFQAESAASVESGMAANLADERFSWVVDGLGALVTAAVLGYGAHRAMSGAISPGDLVVFFTYIRNFYKPMRTSVKHASKITKVMAKAERVVDLLDIEEGITDRPGALRARPFYGQIDYRGVSFEYESGAPVLVDITVTIPSRRVTAIVGPTGAGKTTLVSLIPRLYDPTRGSVLIDGHDVREYTLQSIRSQISMVLQESVLFRTTIAENIGYGREDATPDEIVAAAKAANAHDFIMELPEGYATEIGERGDTLSGGQRQRIAIARAMVRNAPILILDEPLAGLDAASAASVMEALERLMRDRTVIIITHQLTTAQRADYVLVFEGGRITQQGTQKEVSEGVGTYRDLLRVPSIAARE